MTLPFEVWWASAPDVPDDGAPVVRRIANTPAEETKQESDRAAFARLRMGDEAAMATLFFRYASPLERVAASVVRDPDTARDAVQIVFTRLWERRAELEVPDDVVAYLHRAVYHAAQNLVRTARREETRRTVSEEMGVGRQTPSSDRAVTDAELETIVRKAIFDLNGRSGEVFRLAWTGRLTYAQIAAMTGMTVKGVEKARARAITQLRAALRGYWP